MGGDLNMKKGWHTQTRENLEKVRRVVALKIRYFVLPHRDWRTCCK